MINRTFLLVITLFAAVASQAQIRYGVRAGAGLNNVSPLLEDYSFKSIIGPTAGAMATVSTCDWIDVQMELNYAMRGYKDNIIWADNMEGTYKVRSSYLEVPLLLKVFPVKTLELNLQVGPQVGFLLDRSVSTSPKKSDEVQYLKGKNRNVDAAFVFGLGYDNGKWTVDTRYTLGLTKTYKDWNGYKNRGISVSVGYYF